MRRPAAAARRHADAADRRGRRAAQPGPAHARRPGRPRRLAHPHRPEHRRRALPGNPLLGSADANARRIIAYGLRNPFRFTFRPGTNEIWIGDVGWDTWEEIDRHPQPDGFGDELRLALLRGRRRQAAGLRRREPRASARASTRRRHGRDAPYFAYRHSATVGAGRDAARPGSSSIAGIGLRRAGGDVPARLRRRAVLRRLLRNCIWVDARRRATACPTRHASRRSSPAPSNPVDLADRARRRPLLRRPRRRHDPADPATPPATSRRPRSPPPTRRRRTSR